MQTSLQQRKAPQRNNFAVILLKENQFMQNNYNPYNNNEPQGGGGFPPPPPWGYAPYNQPPVYKPYPQPPVISPEEIKRKEERGEIRKASNAAGISLISLSVFGTIISLFLSAIITVIFGEAVANDPAIGQLLQIIFSLFCFTVPYIVIYKLFNYRISNLMSFKRSEKGTALPLFFIGIAFCSFANIGASYINSIFSAFGVELSTPSAESPRGIFGFFLSTIATAIVPALVEEFACRGIILGSLRKYGDTFALVASSISFGVMHGNLGQIPFAAFLGLIIGYTVLKTGSMRVAIAIHFFNNFTAVLFDYLQQGLSEFTTNMIYIAFQSIIMALGVIFLCSKKIDLKLNQPPKEIVTTTKKKYVYFFTTPIFIIFIALNLFSSAAISFLYNLLI